MVTKKTKVLIIDDEKDFCYFIKQNLQAISNYKVITATGGRLGGKLTFSRKHSPDVILLDIVMAGMDGFKVLKWFRESKKTAHTPIIMLTAKGDAMSKMQARSLGCDDYIVKPIEAEALKEKIEGVLTKCR